MKELALAAAKRMREAGLSSNLVSFNSVLEMSQSLSEARETFEGMQKKQIIPDVSTYNRMAGFLKRVGLYHEALQEIEDADSAGLPLNLHILTTAASLYSHVGMHEEALEACGAMRKCGFTLDAPAFNAMIYAFGNAGRVDEAVRISMEMQNKEVKSDVVTHTTLITVYAKMGLIEGVSRVYKRMKKAQCEPNGITYKQLISIYKDAGREDLAAMVFQERQFARYLAKQFEDAVIADSSSIDATEEEQEEVESAGL
jgi:pentatricopeptide repeat protein